MKDATTLAYNKKCMISHRPKFMTGEPLFYRCPTCGEIIVSNSTKDGLHDHKGPQISCCGAPLAPLEVCTDEALIASHKMHYVIFGGFENNSLRIEIDNGFHPIGDDHRIEWIYARTFQGGQLKFLPPRSRSIAHFSFADHDSFVYCDRDVCKMGREHCQFLCKRGMVVYAYCNKDGLFRMVMEGNEQNADKDA